MNKWYAPKWRSTPRLSISSSISVQNLILRIFHSILLPHLPIYLQCNKKQPNTALPMRHTFNLWDMHFMYETLHQESKKENLSHGLRRHNKSANSINKHSLMSDVTIARLSVILIILHSKILCFLCSQSRGTVGWRAKIVETTIPISWILHSSRKYIEKSWNFCSCSHQSHDFITFKMLSQWDCCEYLMLR